MSSVIYKNGRVTLPADVRRRLGLKPGDEIEYVMVGGDIAVQPVRKKANPIAEFIDGPGRQPNGAAVAGSR
jgi:AbrB family looped-hinge helix DNA binding protein